MMIEISPKTFKFGVGTFFILLGASLMGGSQSAVFQELLHMHIAPSAVGFLLTLSGIGIMYLEKGNVFVILTLPFALYVVASIFLFFRTNTVQPLIHTTFSYALILYAGLKWR